jgi:hypothetical protein
MKHTWKRKIIMNVIQMKLNIIIRDIQTIAVEIENLKKRVSDLELAQISVNIKAEEKRNDDEKTD